MLTWHDHLKQKYGDLFFTTQMLTYGKLQIEQMALDMVSLGWRRLNNLTYLTSIT